jgi:hypothetical protein
VQAKSSSQTAKKTSTEYILRLIKNKLKTVNKIKNIKEKQTSMGGEW